jgi:hypothetical protein
VRYEFEKALQDRQRLRIREIVAELAMLASIRAEVEDQDGFLVVTLYVPDEQVDLVQEQETGEWTRYDLFAIPTLNKKPSKPN